MNQATRVAFVITCTLTGGLLAGCGAGTSSNQASPPVAATPSGGNGSAFSRVIRDAMSHVPTQHEPPLMAPTILPQDKISQFGVSNARASALTAPNPGYAVQLLSGISPLASFGATVDANPNDAALAVQTNSEKLGPLKPVGTGVAKLGGHLTAIVTHYQVSATSSKAASMSWTTSRWRITVTNYAGGTVPMAVAQEVMADLKGQSLPVPQSQGALFVNLGGSAGVRVDMQWQHGSDEYFVDTYNTATDPIMAAIQMTASMEPYPS